MGKFFRSIATLQCAHDSLGQNPYTTFLAAHVSRRSHLSSEAERLAPFHGAERGVVTLHPKYLHSNRRFSAFLDAYCTSRQNVKHKECSSACFKAITGALEGFARAIVRRRRARILGVRRPLKSWFSISIYFCPPRVNIMKLFN